MLSHSTYLYGNAQKNFKQKKEEIKPERVHENRHELKSKTIPVKPNRKIDDELEISRFFSYLKLDKTWFDPHTHTV